MARKRKTKYKVEIYYSGRMLSCFETNDKKEVKRAVAKSDTGDIAVRVYENGIKLPYIISNSRFYMQNRFICTNKNITLTQDAWIV